MDQGLMAAVDVVVESVAWRADEQGTERLVSVVHCTLAHEAWVLRFQILPSLEMILPMRALGREEVLFAATSALRQYLAEHRPQVEGLVRTGRDA